MLLLERQQYGMNDSLEKMYPLLNSIKQATIWYLERHTEIFHPLQPRRIKAEFIRNSFDNEIYIALKKGDYAYVHRS